MYWQRVHTSRLLVDFGREGFVTIFFGLYVLIITKLGDHGKRILKFMGFRNCLRKLYLLTIPNIFLWNVKLVVGLLPWVLVKLLLIVLILWIFWGLGFQSRKWNNLTGVYVSLVVYLAITAMFVCLVPSFVDTFQPNKKKKMKAQLYLAKYYSLLRKYNVVIRK